MSGGRAAGTERVRIFLCAFAAARSTRSAHAGRPGHGVKAPPTKARQTTQITGDCWHSEPPRRGHIQPVPTTSPLSGSHPPRTGRAHRTGSPSAPIPPDHVLTWPRRNGDGTIASGPPWGEVTQQKYRAGPYAATGERVAWGRAWRLAPTAAVLG